jgi:hypothetical protein
VPRGGYRPGAGRKPTDGRGRTERIMINLTPVEAQALDGSRGAASRSEAARVLLLRALGVEQDESGE